MIKTLLFRLIERIIGFELRFVCWQIGKIGQKSPIAVDTERLCQLVDERVLPLEIRMAISKLIVARRRGI